MESMTDPIPQPAAAEIPESEEQLVSRAQQALSDCYWTVGECASKWTRRYAKGRTDADFGALIGMSADQVFQRRRVWETFSDVYSQFAALRWSHFYAALNWDDAPECLQWADEMRSTVAEMKAWRRAMRGEDLTAEPEESDSGLVSFLSAEPSFVQDPDQFGGRGDSAPRGAAGAHEAADDLDDSRARLAGVARGLEQPAGGEYAPFHQGAVKPAPQSAGGGAAVSEPPASPEQTAKRICSTLDRCNKALTPEFSRAYQALPEKLRQRLTAAVEELAANVARLNSGKTLG
jgi:hypothetical protein